MGGCGGGGTDLKKRKVTTVRARPRMERLRPTMVMMLRAVSLASSKGCVSP